MSTIVALATPAGRSGIGVVRISGEGSLDIARKISGQEELIPRRGHLRRLRSSAGQVLDEAVVTYFRAPHSFTGDDVIEISCHGSPVVLRQVIDECLAAGARVAEPGEFSLRAVANGKLDLSEAEAIRDLINAQTTTAARQALRQLGGEFSHRLSPIKDCLLDVIVLLESALEFVEDDLPATQLEEVTKRLEVIAGEIEAIAASFHSGKFVRQGLRVAIVGRPNVGKSSLFNALVGSERAIVTDIAGTTRDQIHEDLVIHGIPVSLIDTAGLRDTMDTVESIGVDRSRKAMVDADLVIVVLDASGFATAEDLEIIRNIGPIAYIVAFNKTDIEMPGTAESVRAQIAVPLVRVSSLTGSGLDELKEAIARPFVPEDLNESGFLVTDARHYDLLVRSVDEVRASIGSLSRQMSEEIVLVGLHNALRYLGQITGETTTEDVLTRIFSTFCIGK